MKRDLIPMNDEDKDSGSGERGYTSLPNVPLSHPSSSGDGVGDKELMSEGRVCTPKQVGSESHRSAEWEKIPSERGQFVPGGHNADFYEIASDLGAPGDVTARSTASGLSEVQLPQREQRMQRLPFGMQLTKLPLDRMVGPDEDEDGSDLLEEAAGALQETLDALSEGAGVGLSDLSTPRTGFHKVQPSEGFSLFAADGIWAGVDQGFLLEDEDAKQHGGKRSPPEGPSPRAKTPRSDGDAPEASSPKPRADSDPDDNNNVDIEECESVNECRSEVTLTNPATDVAQGMWVLHPMGTHIERRLRDDEGALTGEKEMFVWSRNADHFPKWGPVTATTDDVAFSIQAEKGANSSLLAKTAMMPADIGLPYAEATNPSVSQAKRHTLRGVFPMGMANDQDFRNAVHATVKNHSSIKEAEKVGRYNVAFNDLPTAVPTKMAKGSHERNAVRVTPISSPVWGTPASNHELLPGAKPETEKKRLERKALEWDQEWWTDVHFMRMLDAVNKEANTFSSRKLTQGEIDAGVNEIPAQSDDYLLYLEQVWPWAIRQEAKTEEAAAKNFMSYSGQLQGEILLLHTLIVFVKRSVQAGRIIPAVRFAPLLTVKRKGRESRDCHIFVPAAWLTPAAALMPVSWERIVDGRTEQDMQQQPGTTVPLHQVPWRQFNVRLGNESLAVPPVVTRWYMVQLCHDRQVFGYDGQVPVRAPSCIPTSVLTTFGLAKWRDEFATPQTPEEAINMMKGLSRLNLTFNLAQQNVCDEAEWSLILGPAMMPNSDATVADVDDTLDELLWFMKLYAIHPSTTKIARGGGFEANYSQVMGNRGVFPIIAANSPQGIRVHLSRNFRSTHDVVDEDDIPTVRVKVDDLNLGKCGPAKQIELVVRDAGLRHFCSTSFLRAYTTRMLTSDKLPAAVAPNFMPGFYCDAAGERINYRKGEGPLAPPHGKFGQQENAAGIQMQTFLEEVKDKRISLGPWLLARMEAIGLTRDDLDEDARALYDEQVNAPEMPPREIDAKTRELNRRSGTSTITESRHLVKLASNCMMDEECRRLAATLQGMVESAQERKDGKKGLIAHKLKEQMKDQIAKLEEREREEVSQARVKKAHADQRAGRTDHDQFLAELAAEQANRENDDAMAAANAARIQYQKDHPYFTIGVSATQGMTSMHGPQTLPLPAPDDRLSSLAEFRRLYQQLPVETTTSPDIVCTTCKLGFTEENQGRICHLCQHVTCFKCGRNNVPRMTVNPYFPKAVWYCGNGHCRIAIPTQGTAVRPIPETVITGSSLMRHTHATVFARVKEWYKVVTIRMGSIPVEDLLDVKIRRPIRYENGAGWVIVSFNSRDGHVVDGRFSHPAGYVILANLQKGQDLAKPCCDAHSKCRSFNALPRRTYEVHDSNGRPYVKNQHRPHAVEALPQRIYTWRWVMVEADRTITCDPIIRCTQCGWQGCVSCTRAVQYGCDPWYIEVCSLGWCPRCDNPRKVMGATPPVMRFMKAQLRPLPEGFAKIMHLDEDTMRWQKDDLMRDSCCNQSFPLYKRGRPAMSCPYVDKKGVRCPFELCLACARSYASYALGVGDDKWDDFFSAADDRESQRLLCPFHFLPMVWRQVVITVEGQRGHPPRTAPIMECGHRWFQPHNMDFQACLEEGASCKPADWYEREDRVLGQTAEARSRAPKQRNQQPKPKAAAPGAREEVHGSPSPPNVAPPEYVPIAKVPAFARAEKDRPGPTNDRPAPPEVVDDRPASAGVRENGKTRGVVDLMVVARPPSTPEEYPFSVGPEDQVSPMWTVHQEHIKSVTNMRVGDAGAEYSTDDMGYVISRPSIGGRAPVVLPDVRERLYVLLYLRAGNRIGTNVLLRRDDLGTFEVPWCAMQKLEGGMWSTSVTGIPGAYVADVRRIQSELSRHASDLRTAFLGLIESLLGHFGGAVIRQTRVHRNAVSFWAKESSTQADSHALDLTPHYVRVQGVVVSVRFAQRMDLGYVVAYVPGQPVKVEQKNTVALVNAKLGGDIQANWLANGVSGILLLQGTSLTVDSIPYGTLPVSFAEGFFSAASGWRYMTSQPRTLCDLMKTGGNRLATVREDDTEGSGGQQTEGGDTSLDRLFIDLYPRVGEKGKGKGSNMKATLDQLFTSDPRDAR